MRAIALIIAKGESTRLPNKNILPFCGLPLVAWSIIQSANSKLVDMTFLSTESEAIAEIGRKYGAEVIWRDYAPKGESGGSVLNRLGQYVMEKYGVPTNIVSLLPTAPLRKIDDIDNMILSRESLEVPMLDAMFIRKETMIYEKQSDNIAKLILADKQQKYLEECGATAIRDGAYFKSLFKKGIISYDKDNDRDLMNIKRAGYEDMIYYYLIEEWQMTDIDYLDDFRVAEAAMKEYLMRQGAKCYERYANG